jgi:hypothetical protein
MNGTPEIVIYEGGEARVEVRVERENVWLSLQQLADLFGRDKSVISRHLRNIFATGELERDSVVAKNATTAADGKTYLVEYYSLDAIISVGYRVNSTRATRFRQWATRILRDHLLIGYTLNERRLAERGLAEAQQAIALLARTLMTHALVTNEGQAVLDVVQRYTRSWQLLLAYDEQRLADQPRHAIAPRAALPVEDARAAVASLRNDLVARGEAGPLLARNGARPWLASWARLSRLLTVIPSIQTSRYGQRICSISSSRIIPSPTATSASAHCSFSNTCAEMGCCYALMARRALPPTLWWRWLCSSPKATARRRI